MKQNVGLRLALSPCESTSKLHSALAEAAVSLFFHAGLSLFFCGLFPSLSWPLLFFPLCALATALWLLELTGKGAWFSLALTAVLFAVCAILHERVIAGLGCLGNELASALTRATGKIHLSFNASQGGDPLWGILPAAAISALLLHQSIRRGKILYVLPLLAFVFAAAVVGLPLAPAAAVFLDAGTFLLFLHCAFAKSGCLCAPTVPLLMLLCAVISGAIALTVGDSGRLPRLCREGLHTLLYDHSDNAMPEGDLHNLPARKQNDTPALRISMTHPQKLYLRGQIFEVYDGQSWQPTAAETRAEYADLFYWLHESDFYGQSQLSLATSLVESALSGALTVESISACSAHGYYPYAVCGSFEKDRIGDDALPSAETMQYLVGSVPQWYAVQQELAAAQQDTAISAYLAAADAYNAYLSEVVLGLTNESWSVLNRQVGDAEAPKTLSDILEFIRDYLGEALVYDEEIRTRNGDADFLQYTLEVSGSGYSVHYATAATLLLRYFGVPARYVEGYYLSTEEAEKVAAGEPITLTERHAHAWAEYYLAGVGFVPFETTPDYIDENELALGNEFAQEESLYSGEHLSYAKVEQPELIREPEERAESISVPPSVTTALLLLLPLLLFAAILLRRQRLRKALAQMEGAKNREAIALRYSYARTLMSHCDISEIKGHEDAAALNSEALFSDHPMLDGQRRSMERYAKDVLAACMKKWNPVQRLYYRLWHCLY